MGEYFLATIEDAVTALKSFCQKSSPSGITDYKGYYCGVTNNIDRREIEHKVKFLGYVYAKSVKGALDLEARMHQEGFNTGDQLGNAGADSKYVYVYKMTKDTVE